MEIYIIFGLSVIVVAVIIRAIINDRSDDDFEKQFSSAENANSGISLINRKLDNGLSDAQTTVIRIDSGIERSSERIGRAAETADCLESRIRELERTSRTSEELIEECERIIEEAETEERHC